MQRIKITQAKVICQGANDGLVTSFTQPAGNAREGHQQIGFLLAGGRASQDMQAIADLGFLEIAEIGVKPGQVTVVIASEARIKVKPVAAGEIEDIFFERRDAAAVKTGGEIVFINQRLQVFQWTIGFSTREGRCEMVYDHRRGAALGLGAFTGIIDNEGIKLRQGAMGNFGVAVLAQTIGLARQPFQIAMLAIVDNGVDAELKLQPEIKREVAMGRHQGRVMVGGLGIDTVTAGGLDGHGHIAIGVYGKNEGAIAEEGIGFGNAPALGDLFTDGVGEVLEIVSIIIKT